VSDKYGDSGSLAGKRRVGIAEDDSVETVGYLSWKVREEEIGTLKKSRGGERGGEEGNAEEKDKAVANWKKGRQM